MYSEAITQAKPHTQKKFELITNYVDGWARKILGYQKSKGVIYIDCMSNSGKYYDDDNKIIDGTAISVASKLNDIIKDYPGKKAIIFYNDKDKIRIEVLRNFLNDPKFNNLEIHFSVDDANEFLKKLDIREYCDYNTLMIYDPYDASIDWDAITPFLNTWGEVIINHMISDTIRAARVAQKQSTIKKYEQTYQSDIQKIIDSCDMKKLDEAIQNIIHNQYDKRRKHFVASIPFYNRKNGLVYNLIHCSSNINGLILYKKIAWKTFGGKSSLINTHDKEKQLCFNFDNLSIQGNKVKNCYFVEDIADYVYIKYHDKGKVSLSEIYADLDRHPIFPSEGFKQQIKKSLKEKYNAKCPKGKNNIIFDNKDLK